MSLNRGKRSQMVVTPLNNQVAKTNAQPATTENTQISQTYFACRCTFEGLVTGTLITCPRCGGKYRKSANCWVKIEDNQ